MSSTVPFVAFAVFAVANWVAVARGDKQLEYLTKPATLVALTIWAATGDDASPWLIAALALSLLGDVCPMLPIDVFTAGLGRVPARPRRVCHRLRCIDRQPPAVAPGRPRSDVAVRDPIVRAVANSTLRIAVIGYMAVIALMVGSALASGLFAAQIGGPPFMTSDTILAWNLFVCPLSWARPAIR